MTPALAIYPPHSILVFGLDQPEIVPESETRAPSGFGLGYAVKAGNVIEAT